MRQILQILQKQYLWYCAASRKFSNFSQNELLAKNVFIGVEFKMEFQNRSTSFLGARHQGRIHLFLLILYHHEPFNSY
jgi:heme oxygenase